MRIFLSTFFSIFLMGMVHAQYWYGPKVGINRSNFIYQEESYTLDSFDVKPTINFELGGVMIYQATDLFSVQGEIYYERINKTLANNPTSNLEVLSESTNHFLSIPMLFRVSFGNEPIHYYIDGGIKLKYWLGGNGQIDAGEQEFGEGEIAIKKVVFKQSKSKTQEGIYAVRDANIMQFGLSLGGGIYLDLVTNGRLLLDCKYTFGHSNMGFNNNPDYSIGATGYRESFTYRSNTLSVSVAYLFEFDQKLQKKGGSTSDQTKKARGKK